jgi:hypothetical protein
MMLQKRLRLDDLLARDIEVQWFEGVALVQAVCRQILTDRSGPSGFPASTDILLGPEGTTVVASTLPPAESVAAAGRTLAELLGDLAPVTLRLVVTQATGAGYQSLQELSDALAYFERPDPDTILRNLHDRAWAAECRDGAPPHPAGSVTQGQQPRKGPADQPPGGRSRGLAIAGTAGVLVCALIWLVALGSPLGPVGASMGTLTGAVQGILGQEPDAPSQEVGQENAEPPAASHTKAGASQAGAALPSRRPPEATNGTLSLPLPPLAPEMSSLWAAVEPLSPPGSFDPALDADRAALSSSAPRIYSAWDPGVQPPRAVYPQLPDTSASAPRLPDDTVLEMVIGTDGFVERVKLRSTPRNIHEFMLVSAAKTWRFEPARLDGAPVRFLHSVVVTVR